MDWIKVFARIRPYTKNELLSNIKDGWIIDEAIDRIWAKDQSMHHHPFTFDKIFTEEKSNKEVYLNSCQQIVEDALQGIDTTVFMFG